MARVLKGHIQVVKPTVCYLADDAWLLDMAQLQWTQLTLGESHPRLWHTCSCTGDGELIVFGGCENDILNYEELSVSHTHCIVGHTAYHFVMLPNSLVLCYIPLYCKL